MEYGASSPYKITSTNDTDEHMEISLVLSF